MRTATSVGRTAPDQIRLAKIFTIDASRWSETPNLMSQTGSDLNGDTQNGPAEFSVDSFRPNRISFQVALPQKTAKTLRLNSSVAVNQLQIWSEQNRNRARIGFDCDRCVLRISLLRRLEFIASNTIRK